jgi:signal transduction histidine kinase
MSEQTSRRLAWSIAVFSVILVIIGEVLSILAPLADGQLPPFSHQLFTPVATIAYGVVGALVASRHPRNPIGWLFCATGFLSSLNMFGAGYMLYDELALKSSSLPGANFAQWLNTWVWMLNGLLPVTFLLLLFPDGHLPSPRWRPVAWIAGLGIIGVIFGMAFRPILEDMGHVEINPFGIPGSDGVMDTLTTVAAPLLLIGILGSITSVIVRFRNAAGIERAQLKWLAFAGVIVIVGNILAWIPWAVWPDNPLSMEVGIIVQAITITNIVAAAGIAILRYRLWDIDIVINRTLVYISLSAIVVGVYMLLVGSAGALLRTSSSLPISLFATGVVAMSFQPIRERLQRGVNRLMFGERDEPYAVLGRLSQRLEVVVAAPVVLPTIVETVAEALKLPYAAIALKEGDSFKTAAEYSRPSLSERKPDGETEILPLVYQLETIGQLHLAPRSPGEQFSQTDRRLLETIARQAGIAAYNVRLTQDLQRSRERLVTTREEERRRLRRDLHDGLGPILASMSFKLDAIHNLADRNPESVKKMATDLKTQMQGALMDIRRIAYDLRPPALDELGLVGALKEHITACNQSGNLQIALEAPDNIPQLKAAVEVAAYRIAMEAMTNVARHADARQCQVRLFMDGRLCLEIDDDGRGIPVGVRAGVGMSSMRERAEELGGTCVVETQPEQGTHVLVELPC